MQKSTHTGTCQICQRRQALPSGRIAKHGYEVVGRGHGGFFAGTCHGSDYLPFEISFDRLETIASALAEHVNLLRDVNLVNLRARIGDGKCNGYATRTHTFGSRRVKTEVPCIFQEIDGVIYAVFSRGFGQDPERVRQSHVDKSPQQCADESIEREITDIESSIKRDTATKRGRYSGSWTGERFHRHRSQGKPYATAEEAMAASGGRRPYAAELTVEPV
jgi:hypothetical protein